MTIKKIRRTLSGFLFILAIAFASPPIIPFPDDFLNFWVADLISSKIPVSMPISLIISYTLIPIFLLYLSAAVHPRDMNTIMDRNIHKIKEIIETILKKAIKNPVLTIISFLIIYLVYTRFLMT